MSFEQDILSRDTKLFPIVVIGNNIRISTNSVTLNDEGGNPQYYKPLLLNVPSLKESIDIEKTRKYKISNVTLDISNYEHEGVRFSEMVADTSLINQDVDISWVSQTGQKQIYSGKIRRYDMSDDKIKLSLEDRSQAMLHKDLPLSINTLGTDDNIPERYKNQPIPMVVGYLDKSPCVISKYIDDNNKTNISILADNDNSVSVIFGNPNYESASLYFYDGSGYTGVPKAITLEPGIDKLYEYGDQYNIENNKITMFPLYYNDTDSPIHTNTLSDNVAFCMKRLIPTGVSLNDNEDWYDAENTNFKIFQEYDDVENVITLGTVGNINALRTSNVLGEGAFQVKGHIQSGHVALASDGNVGSYKMDVIGIRCEFPSLPSQIISKQSVYYNGSIVLNNDSYGGANDYSTNDEINIDFVLGGLSENAVDLIRIYDETEGGITGEKLVLVNSLDENKQKTVESFAGGTIYFNSNNQNIGLIWASNKWIDFTADMISSYLITRFYVKDFDKNDFYCPVSGRYVDENNAPTIIGGILEEELGIEGAKQAGMDAHEEGSIGYSAYNFAINEKTNSKQIIEELASASNFIPRFNNLGAFKFNYIKNIYDDSEESTRIEEADCINWSYSRTKIEDVYTKIEFKYKWDYARREFDKDISFDVSQLEQFDADDSYFDYYGIPSDHSESTLSIDDNRGKYITDWATARNYLKWRLYWSCNQHLKMKIKLPLKYMGIEVGSLLSFEKVLGDVKPYGIDYKHDSSQDGYYGNIINKQQIFSMFICTSTNKTLEFVEVECIQLHNLYNEMIPFDAITGITDETAWNYDPGATFSHGTPVYVSDFIQPGCPYSIHPMTQMGQPDPSENYSELSDQTEEEGVFKVSDIGSPDLDIGGKVYNYWNDIGTPIVLLGTNCIWQDIILHEIESVLIKDSNGAVLGTSTMVYGKLNPIEIISSETTFSGQIEFIFKNNPLPTFSGAGTKLEVSHIPTFENFDISTNNKLIHESFTFEVAEGGNNINIRCFVGSSIVEFNVNLLLQLKAFHPYDFNKDGFVNQADLLILQEAVFSGTQDLQYDISGDGTLDTIDIIAMANFILDNPELTGNQ